LFYVNDIRGERRSLAKKAVAIGLGAILLGFFLYEIFKPKAQAPSGVEVSYVVVSQGPPYIIE